MLRDLYKKNHPAIFPDGQNGDRFPVGSPTSSDTSPRSGIPLTAYRYEYHGHYH